MILRQNWLLSLHPHHQVCRNAELIPRQLIPLTNSDSQPSAGRPPSLQSVNRGRAASAPLILREARWLPPGHWDSSKLRCASEINGSPHPTPQLLVSTYDPSASRVPMPGSAHGRSWVAARLCVHSTFRDVSSPRLVKSDCFQHGVSQGQNYQTVNCAYCKSL